MTTIQTLFAGILILSGAVGCQSPTASYSAQSAGRYQLSEDLRFLYITDTATGMVWHRGLQPRDGQTWESLGGPTTQP